MRKYILLFLVLIIALLSMTSCSKYSTVMETLDGELNDLETPVLFNISCGSTALKGIAYNGKAAATLYSNTPDATFSTIAVVSDNTLYISANECINYCDTIGIISPISDDYTNSQIVFASDVSALLVTVREGLNAALATVSDPDVLAFTNNVISFTSPASTLLPVSVQDVLVDNGYAEFALTSIIDCVDVNDGSVIAVTISYVDDKLALTFTTASRVITITTMHVDTETAGEYAQKYFGMSFKDATTISGSVYSSSDILKATEEEVINEEDDIILYTADIYEQEDEISTYDVIRITQDNGFTKGLTFYYCFRNEIDKYTSNYEEKWATGTYHNEDKYVFNLVCDWLQSCGYVMNVDAKTYTCEFDVDAKFDNVNDVYAYYVDVKDVNAENEGGDELDGDGLDECVEDGDGLDGDVKGGDVMDEDVKGGDVNA